METNFFLKSLGKQVLKNTYVWLLFFTNMGKDQCSMQSVRTYKDQLPQSWFKCLPDKVLWMIFTTEKHKKYEERKRIWCFLHSVDTKGCLISEGILSLVPLPTKGTLSTLAKTEIIYPKSVGA